MKRYQIKIAAVLVSSILVMSSVTACQSNSKAKVETETTKVSTEVSTDASALYTKEDISAQYEKESATKVTFEGTTIQVDGEGATVSENTLTISGAGTYVLSGTLSDGQVVISAGAEDVVRLVLNGVELSCSTSSAIYCEQAKKLIVVLDKDTQNTIVDATTYVYENTEETEPDAAIFSKDDLIFTGDGSLTVTANYHNGIQSKDNLVLVSGIYQITAKNNAIHGKDSVTILDGTYTIDAEHNAIHSKGDLTVEGGTYSLKAVKKAFHAHKAVIVNDGTIDVRECYEGIEGLTIDINGGNINIVASDDGLNAANPDAPKSEETFVGPQMPQNGEQADQATQQETGQTPPDMGERPQGGGMEEADDACIITITGGVLNIDASGDGIDSNGHVYITGGEVYVNGPVSDGDGALDYDGNFIISGGTLVAIGSSGMAQTISDTSTQVGLEVLYTSKQEAGSAIGLLNSAGEEIFSYTSVKEYASIVISTPQLKSDESYALTSNGEKLGDITLSGISSIVDETGAQASVRTMGPGGGGSFGVGPMEQNQEQSPLQEESTQETQVETQ